ncbi:MAG: DNA polymerase, partial [Candidatus Omnitrophota bacterium]
MGDDNGKVKIRETFLPDEGHVFVRVDQSQIESRVGYMYCGTPRLVDLANRRPDEYDAHTDNAALIFKKPHDQITKDERYLGKKTTHGAMRGLAGARMSETVSKDTEGKLFIHPRQCDKLLDTYHAAIWELRAIYFPWVEQQIRDFGFLYDSWGGRIDLRYRRIDADLYREGYSWYLQVEAARWTNQYLFVPTTHYMMARYGKPCSAQVHDEIIVSVPLQDA